MSAIHFCINPLRHFLPVLAQMTSSSIRYCLGFVMAMFAVGATAAAPAGPAAKPKPAAKTKPRKDP